MHRAGAPRAGVAQAEHVVADGQLDRRAQLDVQVAAMCAGHMARARRGRVWHKEHVVVGNQRVSRARGVLDDVGLLVIDEHRMVVIRTRLDRIADKEYTCAFVRTPASFLAQARWLCV